jgi:hypothetical protein
MRRVAQFLHYAGQIILAGTEDFNVFVFGFLPRICQPAVLFGLMYWVAVHLAGYSMNIIPGWSMVWPFIQAIAITAHLAILPGRAIEQAHAGDRPRLVLTVITLALLAASSIPLVGQFDTQTFTSIRMLALVSIMFIEPEQKSLVIGFVGIPVSPDEDEDENPLSPIPVED